MAFGPSLHAMLIVSSTIIYPTIRRIRGGKIEGPDLRTWNKKCLLSIGTINDSKYVLTCYIKANDWVLRYQQSQAYSWFVLSIKLWA